MMRPCIALFLLLTGLCVPGWADAPNPLVRMPRAGAPALVQPGGAFRLVLEEPFTAAMTAPPCVLTAAGGGDMALAVRPTGPWEGGTLCEAVVSPDTPEGRYTLAAGNARYANAVFVVADPDAYYVVAHLHGPGVGEDAAAFADTMSALAQTEAHFALVTGPLTKQGADVELARLYTVLADATVPVFVAGSGTDNAAGAYRHYFPASPYAFRFGEDGYLVAPLLDRAVDGAAMPERGGVADGAVAYWRGAIAPARWITVIVPHYRPGAAWRFEQTVLVDHPVALLLTGFDPAAGVPAVTPSIWGPTRIVGTPAHPGQPWRLVDVTRQGPRPRSLPVDSPPREDTE